jgi:hypothetical protein
MPSPLKTWRQSRREDQFWEKSRARSRILPRGEVIEYIDTAVMMAGGAISRYRGSTDTSMREVQLLELRMNLEAALGMLDNLIG